MVRFLLAILFVLTVCPPVSEAQGTPDLAGRWDGAIELPDSPLEVIVKLRQTKPQQSGEWRGTIDIPVQNNTGVPLQDIQVKGKTITFAITDIPGEPTFAGTISGEVIEGTFSQGGQSFPFSLTRKLALSGAERTAALERGRALIKLFYNRNFNELYAKFSDGTKAVIGQAQLGKPLQMLGRETGVQSETVNKSGDLLTYVRTATFEKVDLFVAVSLTFTPQGVVEAFSLRPRQDIAAPTTRLEYQTKTALQLPFDVSWTVFWGGRKLAENYHAAYPDQRFASDFLVLKGGSSYQGDGAQLEDYYCFGRPIYAPGVGTVVEIVSNLPDLPIGESDTENIAGNYVIINHRNGEFSFLGHLQQGSVEVKAGERVEAGTLIGRCGNSGNTTEPHLHYQLQASATLFGAESLPAQFLNYRADGKRVSRGEPVKGQTVERLE